MYENRDWKEEETASLAFSKVNKILLRKTEESYFPPTEKQSSAQAPKI